MKILASVFGALAAMQLLVGCETLPPDRTTYSAISAELKNAAEQRVTAEQKQSVLQSLLPPIAVELPRGEAVDPGPRFDLTVNNAPATQVLSAIVSGTRYSMVVHPDIKGTMSLNLKDVTILDVLNSVREVYGYEYRIDGTRVFVSPATLQTRLFKIDYLTSYRRGVTDMRVSSNAIFVSGGPTIPQSAQQALPGRLASGGGQATQVETTSLNNFWLELQATLSALVGCTQSPDAQATCPGGRKLIVSPQAGTVLVHAMPDELKNVAAYLRASQASVEKQVLIEAKILEVALNDNYETGINWAKFFSADGGRGGIGVLTPGTQLGTTQAGTMLLGGTQSTPGTPLNAGQLGLARDPATGAVTGTATLPLGAAGGVGQVLESLGRTASSTLFGLAFQGTNFAALITFLESQGVVHTLSSPRIATMNNQKAVLKVGADSLFVTKITGGTVTQAVGTVTPTVTSPTFELQSFFSGIALDVTPRIGEENSIVLHVRPSVSNVSQNLSTLNLGTLGTFTIPLVSNAVSETDSVIRAQDGQIVAIGGLMRQAHRDTRDQVPGLGESPVFGGAFRNTARASEKRELVILLKPTIVQGDQTWAQSILDSSTRVQSLVPEVRRP